MTASDLLTTLTARGAELRAEGDTLRYRAPTGVLTEQDRAALRAHKAELLALLAALADAPALRSLEPAPESGAMELPDWSSAPAADGTPTSGAAARKVDPNAVLSNERAQFRHEWRPEGACGYCGGTAWRLWSTPRHGGAWLWACAPCADRLHAHPPAPMPVQLTTTPQGDAPLLDAPKTDEGGRP